MPLSEKARRYAIAAKDAMVEYACGFVNDPLGSVGDLALDTAYLAGDLATPGGIDAPLRLCRGEASLGEALYDQSCSAGAEMAFGFALGKVVRVGKKVGSALVKSENALTHVVIKTIAEKRSVGQVGRYQDLTKRLNGKPFNDGLHAHHIPSKDFMAKYGVKEADGLSIMMTTKQHYATRTHGWKRPVQTNPRSELAADLWDVRNILRRDGMYTHQVNRDLISGSKTFQEQFPDLFKKASKK
jgi:hypothetical protein